MVNYQNSSKIKKIMSFKFTIEKNIFMYYIDAIYKKKQFLDWKCNLRKNVQKKCSLSYV